MDSVWREIEQLRGAPIAQIRARYRALFGEEPRSAHRQHLFRRVAWRLQAVAEGGLSDIARVRADEIGNDADMRVLPPRGFLDNQDPAVARERRVTTRLDRRIPPPGTVLKRQYRGRTVAVRVLVDGFE